MKGKELDNFMENLAKENFNTYKKYNFNEISKVLEDEVNFTHQFAFNNNARKNKFNKYKKYQPKTNYILNLQLMINENIKYASWGHKSSFNIARTDKNYELIISSLGRIIPNLTARTNFKDGEYSVLSSCVDRHGDEISCEDRKNIVKSKIKIKDNFFDIRSVLEASDEVLAIAGEKRYGNVMSIEKFDDRYLEINQKF